MSGITTIKRTGYLHGGVTHPDGRRGFFKGAQADASAGKGSMSPGTSGSGGNRNSSTNQGPAGGASAGGNYGGNVNPNQTYAGKTPSQTPSNYGGTGPAYYGGNKGVPKSPPPKPKPTKDNTIKKNPFEEYFNYNPTLNILDKISKSKFATNQNAKKKRKIFKRFVRN